MSRSPRLLVPGLPAHVVHRGNNRQRIFHSEADFLYFIHCLHQAFGLARVRMHAYVLMPNHVHLLMTPDEPGAISRFMQSAMRRYVGYYNGRQARTGTLWEGRFHSTSIHGDRYLLACHRYIDMNPVRSGLSASPGPYSWGSYAHYARGQPDSLITPHSLLEELSATAAGRQAAYRALFDIPLEDEVLEEIRSATRMRRVMGMVPEPHRRGRPPKQVSDTGFIVNSAGRERREAATR